jgi:Glycosyltransferase family 20
VAVQGKKVLVGVDDLDPFKGIELKLLGFERVLEEHPKWRGHLVLVQVVNAARCRTARPLTGPSPRCRRASGDSRQTPRPPRPRSWTRCSAPRSAVARARGRDIEVDLGILAPSRMDVAMIARALGSAWLLHRRRVRGCRT